MRLAFEQVSFSYDDAPAKRRRRGNSATDEPAEPSRAWALRDIDFAIEDGEFFGIAGHTGSGKSTLIQHMNGLLHPTAGRVTVDGADLADKRVAARIRCAVGLVMQYPERQLFAASVAEDAAFGPRNLGLGETEAAERAREALTTVGLDPGVIGPKSPFELSGGQQRRVALAGVLAMRPRLLVLDEPAAGLDPQGRAAILQLVASLHAQGITIVMVSHSMDDLAHLADRILVLANGRQHSLGTPAEVFRRAEDLRAVGLDVPAPNRMADALRAAGMPLARPLYDLKSLADDIAAALRNMADQAQ